MASSVYLSFDGKYVSYFIIIIVRSELRSWYVGQTVATALMLLIACCLKHVYSTSMLHVSLCATLLETTTRWSCLSSLRLVSSRTSVSFLFFNVEQIFEMFLVCFACCRTVPLLQSSFVLIFICSFVVCIFYENDISFPKHTGYIAPCLAICSSPDQLHNNIIILV